MPWEDVTINAIDIKKQDQIKEYIGWYVGKRNITTQIGPQVIWNFEDNEGAEFGIFGFTNLNRAMEPLPIGSYVKICYQGTQNVKTKFGLKDVHQVKVQVDKDNFREDANKETLPL